MKDKKGIVFSGIQPSGTIHIGNYLGAIKNWVRLLDDYDSIFCVVDYHAVTVPYDQGGMQERIFDAARINIASGLDPARCTLFVQSYVPQHTELTWVFNCVTPVGDLERMTQFKEKSKRQGESVSVGLLDYPVLQAADILLYKATGVPVGEDQAQHLELSRETARRFNRRFGETFPEPQTMFGRTLKVLGLDGRQKMSKSLDNYIGVLEPEEAIWDKLRRAFTDQNRLKLRDPGDPSVCNIFTIHQGFSPDETVDQVCSDCRNARVGCTDCKKLLFDHMMAELRPIRERASELEKRPETVLEALDAGARRCREIGEKTMEEVRMKMGLRRPS